MNATIRRMEQARRLESKIRAQSTHQMLRITFVDGRVSYCEVRKGFDRQNELRRQLGDKGINAITNIENA